MRLIDADVLRDRMCRQCNVEMSDEPCEPDGCFVRLVIMDMPTIDPESLRPQGEWKHKKHKIFGNTYEYVCSVCGCDYALAEYDYCPNCGAKMKGGTP